jgi:hypothetical protein
MNLLSFMLLPFSLALNQAEEPKFQPQEIDTQVAIGYGLAIGDVDGDGKPDILLADKKQFVWYRNGDWKRFVMIENLTEADNVCIAARDIDGDGKVEVAVGAQWNPGETSDITKSGSVHYLIRPKDPTQLWKAVKLHHEPTIHRMRWVKADKNNFHLVVLPLHGRGNKGGEGNGVKVIAYDRPKDPEQSWKHTVIDETMHLTHNLDAIPHGSGEMLYIGGKEGIKALSFVGGKWTPTKSEWMVKGESFGELKIRRSAKQVMVAGVQPMHGNELTVYAGLADATLKKTVLTTDLKDGHALGFADLLGTGKDQIVVGWREPNSESKVGIKLYKAPTKPGESWKDFWIDDNGIACEDLQIADLDGDGKPEIIAAGRASHNLKIYWNKN